MSWAMALVNGIVNVYFPAPCLSASASSGKQRIQMHLWGSACSFVPLTLWIRPGPQLDTCGAHLGPELKSQPGLAKSPLAHRWVSALHILTHLIPIGSLWRLYIYIIIQVRKLRHGEGKLFSQGHMAKWSHSRDSNSAGLIPESMVNYTLILSILM